MPGFHDTPATRYSRVAGVYEHALAATGLRRGLTRYLERISLGLSERPEILDAGCGTAILGRALLARWPRGRVTAFDLDPAMIAAAAAIARRARIPAERLRLGRADLAEPAELTLADGGRCRLAPGSFDLVVVGAALEHIDPERAIARLAALLRPGGRFLHLGVRDNAFGRLLAAVYRFDLLSPQRVRAALRSAGCLPVPVEAPGLEDAPANLTRVSVLALRL